MIAPFDAPGHKLGKPFRIQRLENLLRRLNRKITAFANGVEFSALDEPVILDSPYMTVRITSPLSNETIKTNLIIKKLKFVYTNHKSSNSRLSRSTH